MTVNERLERLERSAGKGNHDLLLKLDAMSRQIQHQETLLKAFEDANQERYRGIMWLIAHLPKDLQGRIELPIGSLAVTLSPTLLPPTAEQIAEAVGDGVIHEPVKELFQWPTAVHEKPHP